MKSADDILSVIKSSAKGRTPLRTEAARLMLLLHKYARENLLVANIYIKDPAVTLIKRDQKIPIIWEGRWSLWGLGRCFLQSSMINRSCQFGDCFYCMLIPEYSFMKSCRKM